MERKRVLVVDDEALLRETLSYNLSREGYECLEAGDGYEALSLARGSQPDLVVLDVMMPGMDGLDVCRVLRSESDVPIIFLTAKEEELDKVLGLEVGGDDYITKPFSVRELLARVKAQLRRKEMRAGPAEEPMARIQRGPLEIVPAKHQVRISGKPVLLTSKEYQLLLLLATHPGVVFSRDALLERVWHFEYPGATTRTVDVHVNSLRKKIEQSTSQPRFVQTVRGAGYRFSE